MIQILIVALALSAAPLMAGDVHIITDEAEAVLKILSTEEKGSMVGPWYTVGYTVATTIEKVDGRDRLIACYRDPRLLLPTYNDAAKKLNSGLPRWSQSFLDDMK